MKSLFASLLASVPLYSACASTAPEGVAKTPSSLRLCPLPTGALTLHGSDPENQQWPMVVEEVFIEMERITSARFVMPSETKAMVGRIPVGNMRTIVVPPDRVWPVFEAILSQLEFGLAFMTPDDPTIFSVISFTPQSWRPTPTPAEFAVQVPVEDVPAWKEHRAFMITTTVSLNHVDVRELANSMRPILMDPNMQQVVPMGETNSLMISGRAAWVAEFVKSVQEINEFERVRHENEAKEREAGTEATAQK